MHKCHATGSAAGGAAHAGPLRGSAAGAPPAVAVRPRGRELCLASEAPAGGAEQQRSRGSNIYIYGRSRAPGPGPEPPLYIGCGPLPGRPSGGPRAFQPAQEGSSPRGPQDRPEEARLILSQAGSHVCRRALHHPPLQVFIPGKVLGSECVEVQFHCWRSNVQKGNWSAPQYVCRSRQGASGCNAGLQVTSACGQPSEFDVFLYFQLACGSCSRTCTREALPRGMPWMSDLSLPLPSACTAAPQPLLECGLAACGMSVPTARSTTGQMRTCGGCGRDVPSVLSVLSFSYPVIREEELAGASEDLGPLQPSFSCPPPGPLGPPAHLRTAWGAARRGGRRGWGSPPLWNDGGRCPTSRPLHDPTSWRQPGHSPGARSLGAGLKSGLSLYKRKIQK
ncbi:unnamed protein product [Prorocentrum cordatum]|uniref:Uncharacterized protein n=1 Tax=Prorocentrum cordatum TaxID=2364126 RepID=A0ABN9TTS5_9DINO|nr:unnamed protein product [Polarella glacialis]